MNVGPGIDPEHVGEGVLAPDQCASRVPYTPSTNIHEQQRQNHLGPFHLEGERVMRLCSSGLYLAAHDPSTNRKHKPISCLDSPRVTSEFLDQIRSLDPYGEEGNLWKVRVLGEFASITCIR